MKNLLNIFKEYNDPKVYRDLKIGFACLIILGILITFAVSPSLRHEIGIGNNEPVPISKEHHNSHHKRVINHVQPQGQRKHVHSGHQSHAKGHSNPVTTHHSSNGHEGLGGVQSPPSHPHPESPESPSGSPGSGSTPEPSPPNSPSPSHPSENNGGGSKKSPGVETETNNKGKVQVEIPVIKTPPLIEEVTHGVNETVNGVTDKVEETTQPLPVHAELPEVCLLNC